MTTKSFSLAECKIQASILLKQIRHVPNDHLIGIFKQIQVLSNMNDSQVCKNAKLKHALHIIANKYGFEGWNNLKLYFEKTGLTTFDMHSGFLNQWFANYLEAKTYLNAYPNNFLLPYKKHFVICGSDCIKYMGFNPQDHYWDLIQHNWVEPQDYKAWEALKNQHIKIKEVQNLQT